MVTEESKSKEDLTKTVQYWSLDKHLEVAEAILRWADCFSYFGDEIIRKTMGDNRVKHLTQCEEIKVIVDKISDRIRKSITEDKIAEDESMNYNNGN